LEPSQKAFSEQFYEEDENEKPVFEDDLDDIGEYCVITLCGTHSTLVLSKLFLFVMMVWL